jgi:hypothetical protein
VFYTVTSGSATVDGNALTVTGVGSVTVQATQYGNSTYSSATPVSIVITANKAALLVAANNTSLDYGWPIPALSGTITGLVPGDAISASYTTTALQGSAAGTYPITPALIDPNGRLPNYSVTITNGTLTIGAPASSLPLVLSLSPVNATASGAGFTLTVNGAGFASNSVVLWNGAARATTFVSGTQLTAALLSADIATEGTALVNVVSGPPNAAISAAQPFAVVSASPLATISGASLAVAADDSGNQVLSLTGTDFVSGSTLQWNGTSLPTIYVSPWQITATIPASELAVRPATVTVANPAGTSAVFMLP